MIIIQVYTDSDDEDGNNNDSDGSHIRHSLSVTGIILGAVFGLSI